MHEPAWLSANFCKSIITGNMIFNSKCTRNCSSAHYSTHCTPPGTPAGFGERDPKDRKKEGGKWGKRNGKEGMIKG